MKKSIKKWLLRLGCFVLLCLVCMVPVTAAEVTDGEEIQILFVGNSLTKKNQSYRMFQKLAKAGGHSVAVKQMCINGATLKKWANRKNGAGRTLYRVLRKQNWDYVVLQDKSTIALESPKMFQKAVSKLAKVIYETGGELVLNMTWAHQEESDIYSEYEKLTQKKFQQQIEDLYMETGEELGALVAKTGVAFWYSEKRAEEIQLYKDERHPSKAGSYLSACTLYATIFQENVPEKDLMLEAEEAEKLRRIAEKVTFTDMGDF